VKPFTPDAPTSPAGADGLAMNAHDPSPTADVYAADLNSPNSDTTDGAIRFFYIAADAEAGTFARIANVLNIANRAPGRVTLERMMNDGTLRVYVELEGISLEVAHSIQRKLAQLTDVRRVDMGPVPPSGTL
jgi:hypothetical protein